MPLTNGKNISTYLRPTYTKIKELIENNNMSMYSSDLVKANIEIINITLIENSTKKLEFSGLSPETNYYFVCYMENQFGDVSEY